MRTSRPSPARVTVNEHLWIPMPDGVRLAARLWLPEDAAQAPVPALLEYIPYRKADMVRARDARNHPFFAAHGYACLRVDMRGSGDSEGHMPDMYAPLELSDARHVIDWIAAQPWCAGSVGMFGTSWGGTAALQANLDAPEALKAVIAVCATDDRYEDDIHHMGGCILTDTFEWGATLPAILAAPPTPDVGPDWRAQWETRLASLTYPLETWLTEAARGAYWRHGSVRHDADRLTCPILAIGGWADRYSNSVMSLVSARPDLTWGVVGPWGHHYPDHGHPGPGLGFQALALAWWDHWLKGHGPVDDWPRLRLWLREHEPPENAIDTRRGRWIAASPDDPVAPVRLTLGRDALSETPPGAAGWPVPPDLTVGVAAGDTGYFGRPGGLPLEQSGDDARSLSFETHPAAEDRIILGAAALHLALETRGRFPQITARLSDVAPDGTAVLITRALRALDLDDTLDPWVTGPGPFREVTIAFPTVAYRLARGHRLRLAVSAAYWPLAWPSPERATLVLRSGRLDLPVPTHPPRDPEIPLPPAEDLPHEKPFTWLAQPPLQRHSHVDTGGTRREGWHQPPVSVRFYDTGVTFGYETRAAFAIAPEDPLTARAAFEHRASYDRPDGRAEIESTLSVTSDGAAFQLVAALSVQWNGAGISAQRWSRRVPRRYR